MKKIINKSILAIFLTAAAISCSNEDGLINTDENNQNTSQENDQEIQESVEAALSDALTEWGMQYDEVIKHMESYKSDDVSDNTLNYVDRSGKFNITYSFHDSQLCATLIVFDSHTSLDYKSLMSGFAYVGMLDCCDVYEDVSENTMAAIWEEDGCIAIGFTPIKSDAYEQAIPISVATGECSDIGYANAVLSGTVSGVDEAAEVGFIYGMTMDLTENNGMKVSTTSSDEFIVKISGLYDETGYYYRAYAIVNDICYLGEIKEFMTVPYTYIMDGRTFGLVRIEGDGEIIKPFSMMQTEFTDLDLVDTNGDGVVTINELRTLIDDMIYETGLRFRFPTNQEWYYAACGGDLQEDWIYSGSDSVNDVAWYSGNSGGYAHGPALKDPNSIGLYDMCGNYAEICASNTYRSMNDNINTATDGVLRGGCWKDSSSNCMVSSTATSPTTGRIPTEQGSVAEKYAFNASTIRFRLVYSRYEDEKDYD